MIIVVRVSVEVEVPSSSTEAETRLLVETLCLSALVNAGLDPVGTGTSSSVVTMLPKN